MSAHTDPGEQAHGKRRIRPGAFVPPEQTDLLAGPAAPTAKLIVRPEARAPFACRECPARFTTTRDAYAHHDATGHTSTADPDQAFGAGAASRKERAMKNHEQGHEDRLAFIREKLRDLYRKRCAEAPTPLARTLVFVTADDAHNILEAASNLGYTDDKEPRPWFGAIFKGPNWRWVEPKLVPSLRTDANGRGIRTWAWVDLPPTPAGRKR